MSEQSPATDPRTDSPGPAAPDAETGTGELLIEEVWIDGMCGVLLTPAAAPRGSRGERGTPAPG